MMMISAYAWFIWLPHSINTSVNQSKALLAKTLESVSEGLVPLLIEGQLSNIYDNLDIVMEKNPDWVYLSLNNTEGQSLYPFEEKPLPKAINGLNILNHEVTVANKSLGTLTLVYDFSRLENDIKHNGLMLLGLIIGLLMLFFIVAGSIIYIFVLKPTTKLAQASNALANGDYSITLPPTQNDEIGTLINSFAGMRNTISQYTHDLKYALDRAESANIAKTQFLANMSHELRTPMNGILGLSSLLLENNMSKDDHDSMKSIHQSADGLLALLNDLLDFSKIEAGELYLEYTPMNVKDCIAQIFDVMTPLASRKGISLDLTYSPSAPRHILGDSNRIRQILYNLIGNAIKFTDTGGVRIDISYYKPSSSKEGLRFRVEDTGIGIPEDMTDKIFDKFTQADISTSRKFGGTGLGLTISKQLIDMMGGKIGVDSVEGRGSTFWFKIPAEVLNDQDYMEDEAISQASEKPIRQAVTHATTEVAEQSHSQNTSFNAFSSFSALIIDDHPINLLFAKKLMTKLGFKHIATAHNGLVGLEAFKEGNFDIILMDCQMPEMDGFEATGAIRAHEKERDKGEHIPIIALTADAVKGARERCLEVGMDHYMSKPIDQGGLIKALNSFLKAETSLTHSADTPPINDDQNSDNNTLPPVDMEHLRLIIDGGPDEEREFFDLFLECNQEILDQLDNSISDGKNEEWKQASHKLKGSAANLGATALSELCKQAEQGHTGNAEYKNSMLIKIKNEYKNVEDFLKRDHL